MFTRPYAALVFSFLALPFASSVPTSYDGAGTTLWLGKRDTSQLIARGTFQGLPTCDQDPSYSVGPSRWQDGEGTYLGSFCQADEHNGDWHCWTDYFSTGSQGRYDGWVPSGNEVDCATTQSCNDVKASQSQTCKTIGWVVGATITANLDYSIGIISGSGSIAVNTEVNGNKQICSSSTDSTTCSWNDQKCHAIWKAERTVTQLGYIRRSCNRGRTGVNMPDAQQKRPDGYYTVGMQDYGFDLPSPDVVIGCAAMCGDTTYPAPAPPSDTTVTPPVGTVAN